MCAAGDDVFNWIWETPPEADAVGVDDKIYNVQGFINFLGIPFDVILK